MTTRGFNEGDFEKVAGFVDRGIKIAADLKAKYPKMKDFRAALEDAEVPEIAALRADVEGFTKDFPTIGFERGDMRFQ